MKKDEEFLKPEIVICERWSECPKHGKFRAAEGCKKCEEEKKSERIVRDT